MNRLRLLQTIIGMVLLTAAAVSGFGLYRWYWAGHRANSADTASSTPSASALDINPLAPSPAAIPAVRPVFSLQDRDGQLRSITEWDGKSLVLNFWATWCEPCRREIPLLKKLNGTRSGQNIQVIGVAVDFRPTVVEYVEHAGIEYPILIGEQEALDAAAQFGVGEFVLPFTVFTDNRGRIVTLRLGELKAKEADAILDTVVAVNRGTLTLEQAKEKLSAPAGG